MKRCVVTDAALIRGANRIDGRQAAVGKRRRSKCRNQVVSIQKTFTRVDHPELGLKLDDRGPKRSGKCQSFVKLVLRLFAIRADSRRQLLVLFLKRCSLTSRATRAPRLVRDDLLAVGSKGAEYIDTRMANLTQSTAT